MACGDAVRGGAAQGWCGVVAGGFGVGGASWVWLWLWLWCAVVDEDIALEAAHDADDGRAEAFGLEEDAVQVSGAGAWVGLGAEVGGEGGVGSWVGVGVGVEVDSVGGGGLLAPDEEVEDKCGQEAGQGLDGDGAGEEQSVACGVVSADFSLLQERTVGVLAVDELVEPGLQFFPGLDAFAAW